MSQDLEIQGSGIAVVRFKSKRFQALRHVNRFLTTVDRDEIDESERAQRGKSAKQELVLSERWALIVATY